MNRPITPLPRRMRNLPRDPRGVPIPWFAGRDADGHLRFTILDRARWRDAVENRRCWICGAPLGRYYTFVLGPVQTVTRTVTEPPMHRGCAEYAVRVCPFLSNPARERFDGVASPNGAPVNPGMFALWRPFVRTWRTPRQARCGRSRPRRMAYARPAGDQCGG